MAEEGIKRVKEAVSGFAGGEAFDLVIVLGSGLGSLVDQVDQSGALSCRDFAVFPYSSVAGHAGRLVAGRLEGWRVLIFQGRSHLYEGLDAYQVSLPVRIAHELGCSRLLLTNAVGGINKHYKVGDFMFICDHINLMGDNPLRGITRNPFVDLSNLYEKSLFPPLSEFAQAKDIGLHSGILAALMGPSYETPAEIRALSLLGADAVSMSTVPEAIMGKYLGMEVAGLSYISNVAAGLSSCPLGHDEVLEAGLQGADSFALLVRHMIKAWRGKVS